MNEETRWRFYAKIDRRGADDCWPWTAALAKGYGQFGTSSPRRRWGSHRLVYELAYGPIPPGLCVCHRCDNPACCNPQHLFLATVAENNTDRAKKGRNGDSSRTGFSQGLAAGELNVHAKLTRRQVATIRRLVSMGATTQRELARRFGVHATTINRLVKRRLWH